jgi:hypothetical protein
MKTSLYAVFGSLVLGVLAWAHFTGWALGNVDEVHNVPKSVRDNPGSYRSTYGGTRAYTGGK